MNFPEGKTTAIDGEIKPLHQKAALTGRQQVLVGISLIWNTSWIHIHR
jgi:hypothetical protein